MNDLEKIVYSLIFAAPSTVLGVPSTWLRTCFCGRYSEFHLWLCLAKTLAMVINRISCQQRETLH
jgi:hypothetical protein